MSTTCFVGQTRPVIPHEQMKHIAMALDGGMKDPLFLKSTITFNRTHRKAWLPPNAGVPLCEY